MLDSEELFGQEDFRIINHQESNSVICLDVESQENGPSTATAEASIDTPTSSVLHNSENGSSAPTSNTSPASTAHFTPAPTTAEDPPEPHQKRQLEDASSPTCKKRCLESQES